MSKLFSLTLEGKTLALGSTGFISEGSHLLLIPFLLDTSEKTHLGYVRYDLGKKHFIDSFPGNPFNESLLKKIGCSFFDYYQSCVREEYLP